MRRLRRRTVWLVAVVGTALAAWCVPAGAIDHSKLPPRDQRPADAPRGWAHWWDAVQYLKEGNCKAAIKEANYLLIHPQHSNATYSQKALLLHGECYERLQRPDLAMKAYLRALKRYGRNKTAFLRLGDLYLREANPKAALAAYRGAVKMDDRSVRAHAGMAAAYAALGEKEKAEKEIRRVEELGGDVERLRKELPAAEE